jgi:tryptophanyl-tRNA synthetase
MKQKAIIFSGIRPTGKIHIGNYLGAIKQWIELQKKFFCVFCIVDYHGITTPFNPRGVKNNIMDLALDLLTIGINPKKSILFIQSHIPEHTELTWILNTITPMSELKRMTQFKEKSVLHQDYVNVGLFDYPILMASDILLYKANGVPVGDDQAQHVELTRTIARKFNSIFSKTFPEPDTILSSHSRIMSLQDPTKKMSSALGPKHYISLDDSPEIIKQKIMTAVTDTGSEGKEPKSPGVENLFCLLEEFSSKKTYNKFQNDYKNKKIKYVELKNTVAQDLSAHFEKFRQKRKELSRQPKKVEKILNDGAKKAKIIAQKTLTEVKQKMGLI